MGYSKDIQQDSPQSPTTKDTGDWGEDVAAEYLVSLGCAIVERQWRVGRIEIDIIAQKDDRIIFVEVKTRQTPGIDPVEAVVSRKRQGMVVAADVYLKHRAAPFDYQFDIIAVTGRPDDFRIEHIPDAFFPVPRTRSLF